MNTVRTFHVKLPINLYLAGWAPKEAEYKLIRKPFCDRGRGSRPHYITGIGKLPIYPDLA